MPEEPDEERSDPALKSLPLVQREVILFFVLCGIAVVMFLATRSLAEWSREANSETAASWYARGQSLLDRGETAAGVSALRRAVAMDRRRVDYVLALVRGLTRTGPNEEAWQLLQDLREAEPEHTEINYRLAGLAAERGEYADAIRYYNHALFGLDTADSTPVVARTSGPPPSEGAEAAAPPAPVPAPVTREMILTDKATLELAHGDTEEAVSTLATLARVADGDPQARVKVGQLFAMAGDPAQALASFNAAIRLAPGNVEARLGAADAAFSLGQFTDAERHLVAAQRAGAEGEAFDERLALVRQVVARDPLAPGLGMPERVRRLVAGLDWAAARYDHCAAQPGTSLPDAARQAVEQIRRRPRQELRDTDVLVEGVAALGRLRSEVAVACGTPDVTDQAWATIARARAASR